MASRQSYDRANRYCPICERTADAFEPYGQRPDRQCPHCKSKARHRLAWLFLKRNTNLFDGTAKRMLHLAPEKRFLERFSRIPGVEYVSADLESPLAMVRLDLTNLPYADACFGVIYCSHVLEHVGDDVTAMTELHRVLRPGGWAFVQVPVEGKTTYEDATITTPEGRLKHFGQANHVRRYGRDIAQRLHAAGFRVVDIDYHEVFGPEEARRCALSHRLPYYCIKP